MERPALFGNAGLLISFRVGVDDADTVAEHLTLQSEIEYTGAGIHETTATQLALLLPNYSAWARQLALL